VCLGAIIEAESGGGADERNRASLEGGDRVPPTADQNDDVLLQLELLLLMSVAVEGCSAITVRERPPQAQRTSTSTPHPAWFGKPQPGGRGCDDYFLIKGGETFPDRRKGIVCSDFVSTHIRLGMYFDVNLCEIGLARIPGRAT
jgi:hypothetical protein